MKPPRGVFRQGLVRISDGASRSEIQPPLDISPSPAHVRVILADDHPLFLEAVEQVLRLEADFRVVARCRDGVEVLHAVREHPTDLLVLDIRMPRQDGFAVLRELRNARRDIPVVILTAQVDDEEVITLLRLGIQGLVLKEIPPDQLVRCLRDVHAGGRWLEPACLARVTDALLRRQAGAAEALKVLTRREVEVVRKVATGLRNKAIAHELCVSEGTIKIHLHNIYEKLELTGRFALMHWARERELLTDHGLFRRADYIG